MRFQPRQSTDLPTNLPPVDGGNVSSIIASSVSITTSPTTTSTTTTTTTDSSSTDESTTLPPTSTDLSTTLPPTSTSTSDSTSTTSTSTTTPFTRPTTSQANSIIPSTTNDPPASASAVQPTLTPTGAVVETSSVTNLTAPSTTANMTTIVTVVGGLSTTIVSPMPTSLIDSAPPNSDSKRTAIIAGATIAAFAFIVILLTIVFVYRRHMLRKTLALTGKKREGKGLLDGEDFDDDDIPPHMRPMSSRAQSLPRVDSPSPSLLRSRVAENGSIFREEVWPPPGFVDPIAKRNSQVDLSEIVDDVMGPTTIHPHERDLTDATVASDYSMGSATSNMPSFSIDGQRPPSVSSYIYSDTFGASSSQTSFFSPSVTHLPPGASPPAQPGIASSLPYASSSSSSPVFSQSPSSSSYMANSESASYPSSMSSAATVTAYVTPPGSMASLLVPPVRPVSGSTLPKKSSPLARALSKDQKVLSGGPGGQELSADTRHPP